MGEPMEPLEPESPGGGAVARSAGFAEAILRRLAGREHPGDRYHPRSEIARGGQGAVVRVWDEDLRRELAMKVLLGQAWAVTGGDTPPLEARSLGRFLEEAQVTAQLDHPGIVPVHELGLDSEGRVFFTMKLVRGRTLREVFELIEAGKEGWTRTRALSVLLKVCEAMAYAHAKGVIHRDLKPGNVMVGRYGEAYVMDWGLARVLGEEDRRDLRIRPPESVSEVFSGRHRDVPSDSPLVTMDGDVVGTPSYMSPEQALGRLEEVGAHSDVYSAGAMLYHLLAGHAPYVQPGTHVGSHGIWYQVQKGPPAPLHEEAPDAPAELVAICEKAMARDWRERYPDTSHLAEDLAAFLEHRVVHAYRTGAVAELGKWIVRNRGLASALAAGLLAVLAGLVTSLLLKARADRSAALAEERRIEGEKRRDEVLRLSEAVDLDALVAEADTLWPILPARIGAYQDWITRARALAAHVPVLRADREQRGAQALPRTESERQADRVGHPDYPELLRLHGEIACKRRALSRRRDGVVEDLPALDRSLYPADARRLNALARERVAPGRERFGEEPLGLQLALCARELAPENPDAARTAAWGYFALGRDDDALNACSAALEAAPPEREEGFRAALAELEAAVDGACSAEGLRAAEVELAVLEARRAELDLRVDERRTWRFPGEEQGGTWWIDQLTRLIERLETLGRELLAEDAISPANGWSVPKRLAFARLLEQGFAPGGQFALAWERALPAIRAAHPGLELAPQLGLVPIGPDPATGLWEFAHLQTGEPAARGPDGKLVLEEETGLVFVLLPGATFMMGAQARDPAGPNHDPQAKPNEAPVQAVTLSPLFLSKYEMTQGQWLRFTGVNPSYHKHPRDSLTGGRITLLHPVEMVSWYDCAETLRRDGLLLPTEAQWEYAARAGTSTPWWTGELRESLRGNANLADQSAKRGGAPWSTPDDWPDLDDGYAVHAPVDAFGPNPFGLQGVHGNVYEWCRDGSASYDLLPRDGDGERSGELVDMNFRMYRGGCFNETASAARSAHRPGDVPQQSNHALGLRPARAIEQ